MPGEILPKEKRNRATIPEELLTKNSVTFPKSSFQRRWATIPCFAVSITWLFPKFTINQFIGSRSKSVIPSTSLLVTQSQDISISWMHKILLLIKNVIKSWLLYRNASNFFMKFIREIFFPINTKKYDVKYYKNSRWCGFCGQEATNVRTLTDDTGQFSHVERLLVTAAFLWSQKTALPSF